MRRLPVGSQKEGPTLTPPFTRSAWIDRLRLAQEIVQAAELDTDVRAPAFAEVVRALMMGGGDAQSLPGVTGAGEPDEPPIHEDAFFAQLAIESGVEEQDLRDVLKLAGGVVLVTTPTKDLGASAAEQAKNVIPLVAGARRFGLGEDPVDSKAVRAELARKNCYQPRKFAERHLGPWRGFNAGADQGEIVTTSRWIDEFSVAIDRALGRPEGGQTT